MRHVSKASIQDFDALDGAVHHLPFRSPITYLEQHGIENAQ